MARNPVARYRARLGIPGRLRHAAAAVLSEFVGDYVDPTDVKPASGWYRSSPYADVYRWEIHLIQPSGGIRRWLGCWQTLTEFVPLARKNGINVDWEGGIISAKES